MSTFVLMRLLESAPRRYDLGIRLLSLGRIDHIHREMARWGASEGTRVLDIGCGTGRLALACARRDARVTGIDISPAMLDIARQKVKEAGLENSITLLEMSAMELDEKFEAGSFDAIVSSLAFSELSEDEQRFVLRQCHRLLVEGGRLIIGDEVVPSWPMRALHLLLRLPLVIVTYILTQTTTHAVAQLQSKITDAGFQILWTHRSLLGGFETVAAVKSGMG
jgi:demethylmenaquinone methyltransferase/2-methoxy-6-polyprenyl-1,4-benzoquinol methylase